MDNETERNSDTDNLATRMRQRANGNTRKLEKPKYWEKLVKLIEEAADNGEYSLQINGRVRLQKDGAPVLTELMLDDIFNHQTLYGKLLQLNGFSADIKWGTDPSFELSKSYDKFVYVNISWGDREC